jgi:hypothetical protein
MTGREGRTAAPDSQESLGASWARWLRTHAGLASLGLFLAGLATILGLSALGLGYREIASVSWGLWPLIPLGVLLAIVLRGSTPGAAGAAIAAGTLGLISGASIVALGTPLGGCGEPPGSTTSFREEGNLTAQASLRVTFDCGTLTVDSGSETAWRLEALEPGRARPLVQGDEDAISLAAQVTRGGLIRAFTVPEPRDWRVTVPARLGTDLRVTASYARIAVEPGRARFGSLSGLARVSLVDLDLHDVALKSLSFDFDTSTATIRLPARGEVQARIGVHDGALTLCVPTDAGLEVRTRDAEAAAALDRSALVRDGDRWRTPGFADAQARTTLEFDGRGATIEVLTGGTCGD